MHLVEARAWRRRRLGASGRAIRRAVVRRSRPVDRVARARPPRGRSRGGRRARRRVPSRSGERRRAVSASPAGIWSRTTRPRRRSTTRNGAPITDDVVAERQRPGRPVEHRPESVQDTVLAGHVVCAGCDVAERGSAHHQLGRAHRHAVGEVGVSTGELLDPQRPVELGHRRVGAMPRGWPSPAGRRPARCRGRPRVEVRHVALITST